MSKNHSGVFGIYSAQSTASIFKDKLKTISGNRNIKVSSTTLAAGKATVEIPKEEKSTDIIVCDSSSSATLDSLNASEPDDLEVDKCDDVSKINSICINLEDEESVDSLETYDIADGCSQSSSLSKECKIVDEVQPIHQSRYPTRSKNNGNNLTTRPPKRKNTQKSCAQLKRKKVFEDVVIEEESINSNSSFLDDENCEVVVKVLWKSSKVIRIPVRRFQKLLAVYEYFMKLEDVPMERIMLTLKGVNVSPNESADSLNLQVCDFIDGGVVSEVCQSSTQVPKSSDFILKFQDAEKKIVSVSIKPSEKMKTIMTRFSEQVDKPLKQIKFVVDGCAVQESDTIESLDLASGDIIDVVYLK